MSEYPKVKNKKTIVVVDKSRTLFECEKCGGRWSPNLRPGGRLPRGSKNCPHCGNDE